MIVKETKSVECEPLAAEANILPKADQEVENTDDLER
jgi:hypothetical protein